MTTIDLDALERRAKEVRQERKWVVDEQNGCWEVWTEGPLDDRGLLAEVGYGERARDRAEFFAAASPDVVLRLIRAVRVALREMDSLGAYYDIDTNEWEDRVCAILEGKDTP